MIFPPSKTGRPCNRKGSGFTLKKRKKYDYTFIHMCVYVYVYIFICASEGICSRYDHSALSNFTLLYFSLTHLLDLLDKIFIIGVYFLTKKWEKCTGTCKWGGYPGVRAGFIFCVNDLCCNLGWPTKEAARVTWFASQWEYMIWRHTISTFSTSTQKLFWYKVKSYLI